MQRLALLCGLAGWPLYAAALPLCAGVDEQAARFDQGVLNDTARLLAGLELPADSRLGALVPAGALAKHQQTLGASWAELRQRQLDPARAFARAELGTPGPRRVYYPFSGPDALYLLTMFPDVEQSLLTGLEPIGSVPVLAGQSGDAIAAGLAEVRKSLYAILSFSFFRTNDLTVDLRRSRFSGVTPILFVFLAEAGYAIIDVRYVLLPPSGQACQADEAMVAKPPAGTLAGVEIEYFLPGDTGFRKLTYYTADLVDGGLKRTPQYLDAVRALDPQASYIKSASYLMYRAHFSVVRKLILDESELVMQDDSGLPHAWFRPELWEATLYGRYGSPIPLFSNWTQPGLRRAYAEAEVRRLDFGIGYRHRKNDSNLQIYRKRAAPDTSR